MSITLLQSRLMSEIQERFEHATAAMHNAQQRYKANTNLKTKPVSFKGGDRVLFSTKNLGSRAQGANKLLHRFVGPFLVTACFGNQAQEVELPASMRIHNVIHVSLLKPIYGVQYMPASSLRFVHRW